MLDLSKDLAHVRPASTLVGIIDVPPDKSIAHRSALFSAIGDGTSRIVNYPDSKDPQSTLACLRALGAEMRDEDEILVIEGRGLRGLKPPDADLDCGNSGTTMRLLAGILAGQSFPSVLIGDESLSTRPMARIANPLSEMGAVVELTDSHAPIRIRGNGNLRGIRYDVPVASAQVKSCVLLAGLYAEGETSVVERTPSRDHTERMLELTTVDFGDHRVITVQGGMSVRARTWSVPRDFSAAAFFLVAGSILKDSAIRLPRVGLNPSRSGLIDILRAMGARIFIEEERTVAGEPIADLAVFSSQLSGIEIDSDAIAGIIDEIPILSVAAACAEGRTEIRGAGELRHKETDRLHAIAVSLRALGIRVKEYEDGLSIEGGSLRGGTVDSFGDHRIAMAMAIAGLASSGRTTIQNASCASISFPGFWDVLANIAYGE